MDKSYSITQIVENISEGIIAIDNTQRINIINRKAKEIFGISYKYDLGHPPGKIEYGDIIIIGDNGIGIDDGGMSGKDLKKIGIYESIPKKASLVYIGVYGKENEYKFSEYYTKNTLSLTKTISQRKIGITINFAMKTIEVKIDDLCIPYDYIKGIGHIVVLDGDTCELKFYQSKGYTVRGEDLKAIINGKNYTGKIPGKVSSLAVEGEKIYDVLKVSESIDNLVKCSNGEKINYLNKYDDINGRPVRCSIYPLTYGDSAVGAFLKFEDLSNLKEITEEKDSIAKKMHEIEDSVNDPFNPLIGESDEIRKIKEYSKKAALSCSNILILGESGTGKSILARMMHNYSSRSQNKFVEINCGAISESILESELFGYVSGAFTGAVKEGKKGLIEYADGGTLFLDEMSEMPISTQVKLLHVIQNREFIPVGGTKAIHIDIRFICASNRDLKKMVEERKFREDLYYRINVMPLTIPPLRERKEDLHELIESIMLKICNRNKVKYRPFSSNAFSKLYTYNFPGNVRELENIIERALNISEGDYITEEYILINSEEVQNTQSLKHILEDIEKQTILDYIKKFNGDKTKTMKTLEIKKTSFYDKLKKYNIK